MISFLLIHTRSQKKSWTSLTSDKSLWVSNTGFMSHHLVSHCFHRSHENCSADICIWFQLLMEETGQKTPCSKIRPQIPKNHVDACSTGAAQTSNMSESEPEVQLISDPDSSIVAAAVTCWSDRVRQVKVRLDYSDHLDIEELRTWRRGWTVSGQRPVEEDVVCTAPKQLLSQGCIWIKQPRRALTRASDLTGLIIRGRFWSESQRNLGKLTGRAFPLLQGQQRNTTAALSIF